MLIRNYSTLITYSTFEDRYNYLKLSANVAEDTFGFDRWMNQKFYRSAEWKHVRDQVIVRDGGCDLAFPGREIFGRIYIHHMNPMTKEELMHNAEVLLDPEFLVCVSFDTHNAIHYGDTSLLIADPIERSPNDTCLWRRAK